MSPSELGPSYAMTDRLVAIIDTGQARDERSRFLQRNEALRRQALGWPTDAGKASFHSVTVAAGERHHHQHHHQQQQRADAHARTPPQPGTPARHGSSPPLRRVGSTNAGQHVSIASKLWTGFLSRSRKPEQLAASDASQSPGPRVVVFDPAKLPRAKLPQSSRSRSRAPTAVSLLPQPSGISARTGTARVALGPPLLKRVPLPPAAPALGATEQPDGVWASQSPTGWIVVKRRRTEVVEGSRDGNQSAAQLAARSGSRSTNPFAEAVAAKALLRAQKMAAAVNDLEDRRRQQQWWAYGDVQSPDGADSGAAAGHAFQRHSASGNTQDGATGGDQAMPWDVFSAILFGGGGGGGDSLKSSTAATGDSGGSDSQRLLQYV